MIQPRQIHRTVVRPAAPAARPADRLAAFLRRRHPAKTAANVAADCPGVSAEAIEKMLRRGSLPSAITFGRMIACYGPDLLAAVIAPQDRP